MWVYEKTELKEDFGRYESSDRQEFKTKKEAIQYAEINHNFIIRSL